MWFQKINPKFFLVLFLIFSNFWIIKIYSQNFIYGAIISLIAITTALNLKKTKVLILCLLVLLFLQIHSTSIQNLSSLDNDQQRVQQERIRSYPLTYIDLFFKVIWLKPASWIEENTTIIVLSRIEENLFENLDTNEYFFGGFPRNNPVDFEKFPFILLPVFILGMFGMIREKQYKVLGVMLILPISLMAVTGNKNNLGPIILFPIFIASFLKGISDLDKNLKNKKRFYIILIVLVLLTFLLQISYGKI